MIPGCATRAGTARYVERFAGRLPADHFRELGPGLGLASVGIGTYLGGEDAETDALYRAAVGRALERGVNVIDTAVNYRHQRSERAIGAALAEVLRRGAVARDEIVVATKGGFIPFDGTLPPDPRAYVAETYVRPGILGPADVVGSHCMTPRYLADQIERSRANLGLETIDVYYVHNPESELGAIDRPEFLRRLRGAFEALEAAVAAGKIRTYGTATWDGYRRDPGAADYLSLEELVTLAREVGGGDHHLGVIQLPYNLAMPEAFTLGNQRVGGVMVSTLEAARRLGVYVMASASVYQGQLTRGLPPVVAEFLPGLTTDAQRALQFVRSTPGIGTALVGMKSLAHVDENTGVAATSPVPWGKFNRLFSQA
ncbi:MAG: aldo/keto reductase [Candidatus Rokubacteria bacterium]|nr:aldo/keto reductase [Candidatus Rokubacteria bacterium]